MTSEAKIHQSTIALTGETWIAELGDVVCRGFTEEEAVGKLRARLSDLIRQLVGIGRPLMHADTDQGRSVLHTVTPAEVPRVLRGRV